jgi:hypothetical protein
MAEPESGGEQQKGTELVIEDSEAAQRAEQVAAYTPEEKPPSVSGAILGGLGGAMLGAIAWWGIIRATGYELGLIAIGVGVLAGLGVLKFGGRGQSMQIIGGACALVGIFVGRILFYFFGFEDAVIDELVKQGVSLDEARAAMEIAKSEGALSLTMFIKESSSAMDIVMLAIGLFEGWRIPRSQT